MLSAHCKLTGNKLRKCCFMTLVLCGMIISKTADAQISQIFQLVVPPAEYEPEYQLGSDVYLTYDYTESPTDQKPYIVRKRDADDNAEKVWAAQFEDYNRFDYNGDLKDLSREDFYNDCIWTSNVLVMLYMPLPYPISNQELEQMHVDEFYLYIGDNKEPAADLTAKANDIIDKFNSDQTSEWPGRLISYALMHTEVDGQHQAYLTFKATYGDKTYETSTPLFSYKLTFPAVRFKGATHNVECVSGTDAAVDNIVSTFAGRSVNFSKDEALEHEYSINVGITDGNNIDPAIINELEPLRETVVTLNVNGITQSRKLYFKEYLHPGSGIKLSHCDPNNFLRVNEDGSYTAIENNMTIETSFNSDGLRVFGIAGPNGDNARFDNIDLTIPKAEIVAPIFNPTAYRANIMQEDKTFIQQIHLTEAGLDMSSEKTSLAGCELTHSPELSSLSMKVDEILTLPEEPAQPLYSSEYLDNMNKLVILGESESLATDPGDRNMMGATEYNLSLAYTYLFRTGRIIGSTVGAIIFDNPKSEVTRDAENPDTHSAFTTHYSSRPIYLDDVLTSLTDVAAPEAEAEYYSLQGVRVEKSNLAPGIYIERRGNRTGKIAVK